MERHQDGETGVVKYGNHTVVLDVSECPTCGQQRGWMKSVMDGWERPILCTCSGEPCKRCGKNLIPKRGTEYVASDGQVVHVPWFAAMCSECHAEMSRR